MADKRGWKGKGKKFDDSKRRKQTDRYKSSFGPKAEDQLDAERRKKKAHYDYVKLLKKEKLHKPGQTELKLQPKYSDEEDSVPQTSRASASRPQHRNISSSQKPDKDSQGKDSSVGSRFSKSRKDFLKKQEERKRKKEEAMKNRQAREAALESYREKKQAKFKKLCKKTYKGQPVMKNQIEYLLEKIQKQVNQT